MRLLNPYEHECVDRPNLPCNACDWSKLVKFHPGQIVATPAALTVFEIAGQSPMGFLQRHVMGDWGDVDEHDRQENELSLQNGWRILSAYTLSNGTKIWIITEADRSATTFLLPEEY